MATIPTRPPRTNLGFTGKDRSLINIGLFDESEATPANQDGKIPLSELDQAREFVFEAYNNTGATITKGTLVNRATWNTGQLKSNLILADKDAPAFADGYALADITNNNTGLVAAIGTVVDVNTSGSQVGDPVFLANNGGITLTKPASGNIQTVGRVVLVDNTSGIISVSLSTELENQTLVDNFQQNHTYAKFASITRNGVIQRAKTQFKSATSFDQADWEAATFEPEAQDVTNWGAVPGDPGNDVCVAIQAAITAGFKAIRIPDGVFYSNTLCTFNGLSGVRIIGDSASSIIRINQDNLATSGTGVIRFENCMNCGVAGIWFQGHAQENPSDPQAPNTSTMNAIYIQDSQEIDVRQNKFSKQNGHTVSMGGGVFNCTIAENLFFDGWTGAADQLYADLYFSPSGGAAVGGVRGQIQVAHNYFLAGRKLALFMNALVSTGWYDIIGNVVCQIDPATGAPAEPEDVTLIHAFNITYGDAEAKHFDRRLGRINITGNSVYQTKWSAVYMLCNETNAIGGGNYPVADAVRHFGARANVTGNIFASCNMDASGGLNLLQGTVVIHGGREAVVSSNLFLDTYATASLSNDSTAQGCAVNLYGANGGCNTSVTDNVAANCNGGFAYIGNHADDVVVRGNYITHRTDAERHAFTGTGQDFAVTGTDPYDPAGTNTKYKVYLDGQPDGTCTVTVPDNCLERHFSNYTSVTGRDITINATGGPFTLYSGEGGILHWNAAQGRYWFTRVQGRRSYNRTAGTVSPWGEIHVFSNQSGDVGNHIIEDNFIQTDHEWGIFYENPNTTKKWEQPHIRRNVIENFWNRLTNIKTGEGIYLKDMDGHVEDNTVRGFNNGIRYRASNSARMMQYPLRGNKTYDCGAGIRADSAGTDGARTGLIPVIDHTWIDCTHKIRGSTSGEAGYSNTAAFVCSAMFPRNFSTSGNDVSGVFHGPARPDEDTDGPRWIDGDEYQEFDSANLEFHRKWVRRNGAWMLWEGAEKDHGNQSNNVEADYSESLFHLVSLTDDIEIDVTNLPEHVDCDLLVEQTSGGNAITLTNSDTTEEFGFPPILRTGAGEKTLYRFTRSGTSLIHIIDLGGQFASVWYLHSSTGGTPSSGQVRRNSGSPGGTSILRFNNTTGIGQQASEFLRRLKATHEIFLATREDPKKGEFYEVSGNPTNLGSYTEVPVTGGTSTSDGPADTGKDADVTFYVL